MGGLMALMPWGVDENPLQNDFKLFSRKKNWNSWIFSKKMNFLHFLKEKSLPWARLQSLFVLGIRCLFFHPFMFSSIIYNAMKISHLHFHCFSCNEFCFLQKSTFFFSFLRPEGLRCVSARKRELRCSVDGMDRFALITYVLELKLSSLGSHSLDASMSTNLNSIFVFLNYWRMNNAEADCL